ncbi:transferase hexapeptide (six repeat-containing protein) [Mucilaginibacter pineti]|uniref:Transferase hexapeptide (Six repeat-containing protein) n=1 Tax=Mucilaginibacter pineti TaxID=1391627 RepID=A0A1G6Z1V1_9SPHI|nr:DapH/DapD/GlmU-related protein [Mucilaginibacter pineti]SDD95887.1 transferase hexapeptide (six repeat-containing protein) [Mucilaginibacter pineti]
MKQFVISFFRFIGFLVSYIFPPTLNGRFKLLISSLKSGYIKKSFKKCGKNFTIEYPFYHIGLSCISIGNNFYSFAGLRLEAHKIHLGHRFSPMILIGDNVSINYDCHIGCINNIQIGNNVLIASKVFITDHFHGSADSESIKLPPSERTVISKGPVIIEDNVWIGEGVAILPNVTIGKNSIIGANAVVTKSFPKNSVIGGNPAKLIKTIA